MSFSADSGTLCHVLTLRGVVARVVKNILTHLGSSLLAVAARYVLRCCGSEVDVERLFSGCRDGYDIRRDALKEVFVRVLTLLRSQDQSDGKVDAELIKEVMELDIVDGVRNSVLWRLINWRVKWRVRGQFLFISFT